MSRTTRAKGRRGRFIDVTHESRHGPIVVRGYENDYIELSEAEALQFKLLLAENALARQRAVFELLTPRSRQGMTVADLEGWTRTHVPGRRREWTEPARQKILAARAEYRAELAARVRRYGPECTSTQIAEILRGEGIKVSRQWISARRRERER